jgi:electron transfer DM13
MRRFIALGIPLLAALAGCGGSSPSAPAAASAPSPSPSVSPVPASSPSPAQSPDATLTVLRRASLRGANGHSTSGSARIEREGGNHTLRLGDDFRIDMGSVDVYLAHSTARVGDGDVNLGELKRMTGAQSYSLPNDGSQYAYVVLWCRPFRVVIGVGEWQ